MKSFVNICIGSALMMTFAGCAHHDSVGENQAAAGFPLLERTPANQTGLAIATIAVDEEPIRLTSCGGTATLTREPDGNLNLHISEATCSNIETNNTKTKMTGPNGHKSGDVYIIANADRTQQVDITSNKGTSTDMFLVHVVPKKPLMTLTLNWYGDSSRQPLENCEGTVEAKITNGQLNIVLRNVTNCQRFDVLSNAGLSLNYDAKPLQPQGYGTYTASFGVPKSIIQVGSNSFMMQVYSPDRQVMDRFKVIVTGSPDIW